MQYFCASHRRSRARLIFSTALDRCSHALGARSLRASSRSWDVPRPAGPLNPLMFDPPSDLGGWTRGVQMHVLTLSGSMPWQWALQDAPIQLSRIVNDAAIEAHRAWPDRFVAGIAMPMHDPVAALRELDRVAGEPGIRAVHLPNSVENRDLRPFSDYIRRFHYDTLAYYPETLRFMMELVGLDRIVIGTDNYAQMDVEQPNALVEARKRTADDLERVWRRNAKKLFKL